MAFRPKGARMRLVAGVGLAIGAATALPLPVFAQAARQPAPAAAPAAAAAPKSAPGTPLVGFGSNSKEPIKVDSNKLEVFDKENRAVFIGDVVAVQGQTTMRCTTMVVLYTGSRGQAGAQAGGAAQPAATRQPAPAGGASPSGGNSIRQIDCEGPVSLLSGTQAATSDKLVYEADKDIVTLTGKVVIADCDNVQRGERAVYDVKTGHAVVDAGPRGGRVQGVFTPGGEKNAGPDGKKAPPAPGAAKPTECAPKPAAATQPAAAAPSAAQPAAARPAPANNAAPMPLRPQGQPATRG